jgi:hypothetical protein
MIGRLSTDVFSRTNEFLKPQGLRRSLRGVRRLPGLQLMLFVVIVLSGCTSEKNRLDAEAKRVCAIDGGIKVFEKVTLPPEKFHPNGVPRISSIDDQGFGYFRTASQRNLKSNFDEPTLIRHEYRVIRSSDKKVVAISVVYRRRGGSWWDGLMEGDGFTCPGDEVNTTFMQQVFIKGTSK